MAKKKNTGLGKEVLFKQTGPDETLPASKQQLSSPLKEDKAKATYYLSKRIINMLEDAWMDLRQMADRDQKKAISKSVIVEAALEIALVDFLEQGDQSDLYYATLKNKARIP